MGIIQGIRQPWAIYTHKCAYFGGTYVCLYVYNVAQMFKDVHIGEVEYLGHSRKTQQLFLDLVLLKSFRPFGC